MTHSARPRALLAACGLLAAAFLIACSGDDGTAAEAATAEASSAGAASTAAASQTAATGIATALLCDLLEPDEVHAS